MKTLLELVNTVLPEIGFPEVETVVGNTSQLARQALALSNREGRALAKYDWRALIKRNVITTVSSAEAYALPCDFDRFIHATEWNDSTDTRMAGPVPDEYWQADLSGVVVVSVEDRFQVRSDGVNKRLFIRPMPTSSENLTFFYAADTWCRSAGAQRQTKFQADTDSLLLDEMVFELGLKWRLLQAQKRAYQEEKAEYINERGKSLARDGGMRTLRIQGPWEDWSPAANTPDTGFGA